MCTCTETTYYCILYTTTILYTTVHLGKREIRQLLYLVKRRNDPHVHSITGNRWNYDIHDLL